MADIGKEIKFLNKSLLVMDLSDLPFGMRPFWSDAEGNNGTLILKSAHGVELIQSRNLVGDIGGHLYLHYMIADKDETYIVEVITNTVVARHMDISTNFNLNWDNGNQCAISDANSNGWASVDCPPPPFFSSLRGVVAGRG